MVGNITLLVREVTMLESITPILDSIARGSELRGLVWTAVAMCLWMILEGEKQTVKEESKNADDDISQILLS